MNKLNNELSTKTSRLNLSLEEHSRRMNKTTIYIVVMSERVILLYPKTVGNSISYEQLFGWVECGGDGCVRNFKFDDVMRCRVSSQLAMQLVDDGISQGIQVSELLVEGTSELASTGELFWENVDKTERWNISW